MAGYHITTIQKGELGSWTKIREEFEEFQDAVNQRNDIMALLELSDMIGAIEAYVKSYNLSLDDLITMSKATQRAFLNGGRE